MKISAKKERDMARESVISKALELFASEYDDVMLIESNQFCFPLVGVNGTELYARLTVSIPTGKREGSAKVPTSRRAFGSKMLMSASIPTARSPFPSRPMAKAGEAVIL